MVSAPREPPPIRVAFVITGLNTGGAELMLVRLIEHLDRRRFEPYVVSLTNGGDLRARLSALGVGVFELGMLRARPSIGAMLNLTRFLRRWRPSLTHTWMYHADLLGSLSARLAGAFPVIWCIRNSTLDKVHVSRLTRLTVKACAFLSHIAPARIVSCSFTARKVHVDAGYRADRFVVIPNGFDLDHFRPHSDARTSIRKELGLHPDTLIVGLVARFDPQKNHLGFLTAASKLANSLPAVNFILAGKGVDTENLVLMKAINSKGLSSIVHPLGERADVPRLMAGLDVLASASVYGEAFPNVVGEAMACEVPCAVTDVGDSGFVVGETGRVVAAGDTDALAAAMHELLTMSQESRAELGRAARVRVMQHFEIRSVVRQYETLYGELVEAAGLGRRAASAI